MYCMAVQCISQKQRLQWPPKIRRICIWKTHHMYRYESLVLLREGNLEYVCTVQLKSKVSYHSSFTSHEMSASEMSISFQETSDSSLKTSVLSWKTRELSCENHLSISLLRKKMTMKLSCQSAVVIKHET